MQTSRILESGPGAIQPLTIATERRTRWRLFLLSFILTALVGLAFTWLRPPLYQSSALLKVDSRPVSGQAVPEAFIREQLVIHRQRLGGRQLLAEVAEGLQSLGLGTGTESLEERLSARILDDSRLLELTARGSEPELLAPMLAQWIDHYQRRYVNERGEDFRAAGQLLQEQLSTLEGRVREKREALERFRSEYRIVSLERDENRALAKVKALGAALDRASEARAQAAAQVDALRRSVQGGEAIVRPQDQRGLDQLQRRAVELEETLRGYAEQFTEQYMAMDPQVQAVRRNLTLLREKQAELRRTSQQSYLDEAQRTLISARDQEQRLQQELNGFEQQVQTFSARLQTFAAMSDELAALQGQAQRLRDQEVEQAVEAPQRARIELLEPPFVPRAPYAPDYWRDTGISLAAALAMGLLTVGLYRVMTPRESPEILISAAAGLPSGEPEKLVEAALPALEQDPGPGLSAQDCRTLVDTAGAPAALALRLLLSGVQPQRLAGLRGGAFGPGWRDLAGAGGARLALSEPTRQLAADLAATPDALVWRDRRGRALGGEGIDSLLRCAAYDAGLVEAAVLDRRRVFATYLAFIAQQRVDPATLVSHLGPLDADWLALYRRLLRSSEHRGVSVEPCWRHPAAD